MKRKVVTRLVSVLTAFVLGFVVLPWVKPDVAEAENRSGNFSKNYSSNSNPAQYIVNIAFAQEGKTGSQLGYNSDWCAWFVADCARLAGQDAIIPEQGRVRYLASAIKGEETSTPQVGDICIFDWNSVSGPYDHVEIVYKVSGSTVYTIGGNAGSTGSYKTNYVKTRNATATGQVQCYIHPYYNGASAPENDDELGIPYPRPSGNPLLSTGSTGSGVRWLQEALNKANNAGLDVDGQFGSGTKQAVVNFQKANGLEADGIAGPATINKLVEVIKNKLNPPAPSVKAKIKIWMSDSKMGNEVSSFEAGEWCYLCYKIYDEYSGKLISEVTSLKDYKITETIYNPDGSVAHTCTYDNSDNNWIGIRRNVTGTYKWEIKLTITKNGKTSSGSGEFNIICTHSYGSWTTQKSASCNESGVKTRTCSVCGAIEEASISATGHKYVDKVIAPTCKENGYTLHTCSDCGDSYKDKETNMIGHNFGSWRTIKEPTCTERGINEKACLVCSQSVTEAIPMKEHSWSLWRTSEEATCTEDGTDIYKCTKCYGTESRIVKKTGHKYVDKIVAPTSEQNGYTLHTCSNCGDSYKDNFVEKLQIKGDINDDGKADTADLVMLQKWLLGSGELTNWKNADLCEDGVIDAFDIAALRRLLLD